VKHEAGGNGDGNLVLLSSRRKWLGVLAGCGGFAFVGALMISDDNAMGWFVTAVFGVGVLVALVTLVLPARLEVDDTGMTLIQFGRRTRFDFRTCGEFRTWSNPVAAGTTLVVFDYEPARGGRLARASARLSGANSALPDTFGQRASELADQLNQRRRNVVEKLG
jgi:hypothetical protein